MPSCYKSHPPTSKFYTNSILKPEKRSHSVPDAINADFRGPRFLLWLGAWKPVGSLIIMSPVLSSKCCKHWTPKVRTSACVNLQSSTEFNGAPLISTSWRDGPKVLLCADSNFFSRTILMSFKKPNRNISEFLENNEITVCYLLFWKFSERGSFAGRVHHNMTLYFKIQNTKEPKTR